MPPLVPINNSVDMMLDEMFVDGQKFPNLNSPSPPSPTCGDDRNVSQDLISIDINIFKCKLKINLQHSYERNLILLLCIKPMLLISLHWFHLM
ncbi:hypothetical protein RN001_002455 [Aquatica leii]|uniref:Uncharacterized protein n=1 Tax=Aquatica leii TaxID=1421715 RepID=A0AAN7SLU5_9COLE|nr:hypothetical protein RN001_002455 [Aquatica leii]